MFCMVGLVDQIFHINKSSTSMFIFIVLFLGVHSAAFHFLLSKLVGQPFLFEGGVANQRILGQVFQPSSFGVFLILSIYLFLQNHRTWSLITLAIAVSFHPVYLLTAAVIVLGYIWIQFREKNNLKSGIVFGLEALVFVLPILIYTIIVFKSTSPDITQQANDILINFRIPHHTQIGEWLNWLVGIQAVVVVLALIVVRKNRLFAILVTLVLFTVILTIAQAFTKNDTLALLYPWRISVVFIPVATNILVGYIVTRLNPAIENKVGKTGYLIKIIGTVFISTLLIVGALRFQLEALKKNHEPSVSMMQFIKKSKVEGDVFLVPVKMIDFRFMTGAPIYIDSSIPYDDDEVVQWYHRYNLANYFYQRENCGVLPQLVQEGVTKVVIPSNIFLIPCPTLKEIFSDPNYIIYAVIDH
jgi:hypothetical protein